MKIKLELQSPDTGDEDLQDLTRSLCTELNREAEVRAEIPSTPGEVGAKGEPITMGLIVLSLLTSGTAVALFNVFRAFLERKRSATIKLERPDGKKLELHFENVQRGQVRETSKLVDDFFSRK